MKKLLPPLIALFVVLYCDASNVVRAPLEESRGRYAHQRDSGLDKLTDKQWQEQQKGYDNMRRKSEQEMLQRNKSGQQQVVPEKK